MISETVCLTIVLVPYCDIRYDFRKKTKKYKNTKKPQNYKKNTKEGQKNPMFGSSSSPVVCRRAHVLSVLFLVVYA